MGGDHKCPVCQATFTRPQHVARHMRSHTGDRPYKCQYCGDQFARSDLLSRHVNKCHSNEKPPPSAPGSRRKGSASASRATTSKQACDQCVQSSLPCDGCNPCAKCVQRKCRCTFVKFHRQTAPVGPGHNPRLHPSASASQPHLASASHLQPSSRLHPYSQDDLLLGPAPAGGHQSMADNLYSESFSFSPLYPSSYPTSSSYPSSNSSSYPASSASSSRGDTSLPLASDPDFTDKYKAHTEMLRRTTAMNPPRSIGAPSSPTTGPPGSVGEWYDQVNQQERNNRELLQDIDRQFPVFASGSFPGPRSGFTPTGTGFTPTGLGFPSTGTGFTPTSGFPPGYAGSFTNSGTGAEPGSGFSQGTGTGFTPGSSTFPTGFTPGGAYPPNSSFLQDRRRGSTDFGGSSGSEHGFTGSEGGSSMPSSATSSNAHLPGYQGSSEFVSPHMQHQSEQGHGHGHHRRPSSASSLGHQSHRRGEYPPEGGFSATFGLMSLDDPNVVAGLATDGTPFFSNRGGGVGGDSEDPNVTPMPHSSNGGGVAVRGHRSNTLPTPSREIAEAEWWNMYMKRTPGTAGGGAGRPRVASLPSSKTPTTLPERFISSVHNNNHAGRMHLAIPPPKNGNGNTGPGTMHADEDLRSYEAAVKARGAPMALSLRLPRGKRGEAGKGKSASAGTSPQVPNLGYSRVEAGKGGAERKGRGSSRPGSAAGSSSLANVFGGAQQQRPGSTGGRPPSQPQQHVTFAPMDVTGSASPPAVPYGHTAYRMGVASSASPSSRASSTDPGSGGSEVGGSGPEALRPSFKRLPSQTLEPANAKRALLSRDEEEEEEEEGFGSEGKVSGDEGPAQHEMSLGFGLASGGLAERRRRRMSAPSGTSPIAATFVGAGHDLA